jgi:hypothetical protein
LIPIASFLAGSLLSLLLPVLLLIALSVWYVAFIRRVPDTPESEQLSMPAPAAESAQSAPPEQAPPPREG